LADFGTATFTNAEATILNTKTHKNVTGPIDSSSWQNTAITMTDSGGATRATTGSITDSGGTSSFSVTWVASNSVIKFSTANLSDVVTALDDGQHHHKTPGQQSWL
jgi:hypothetical protein